MQHVITAAPVRREAWSVTSTATAATSATTAKTTGRPPVRVASAQV